MVNAFPSQKLLDWFSTNQRALPWRKKYNPYHVWISEIMAQQTRMDQMLPYYARFLKQFPNVNALADADEQSVLKAWEGLGYYSRARNLHHAAKFISRENKGKIPDTKEKLQAMKGVGPYISSAIASIAFEEDVPVVDGNVLRVASRVWGIKDDISLPQTRKRIEKMLAAVLPKGKARNFNQALMELGALVCVPDNPLCNACPLQKSCFALAHSQQEVFPVKAKKGKVPHKHFAMAAIQVNDSFFIRPRTQKLLQGLWEFPQVEFNPLTDSSKAIESKLSANVGFPVRLKKNVGEVTHQYSHFTQHVHVFETIPQKPTPQKEFYSLSEIQKKPLSKVQVKVLEKIGVPQVRTRLSQRPATFASKG